MCSQHTYPSASVPSIVWAALVFLLTFFNSAYGAGSDDAIASQSKQWVYGAGPSTKIVQLFFEHLSKRPEVASIQFIVPERSTKHAGGIRASSRFLFGRTGRPLSEQELALGKEQVFLGQAPIGFVVGDGVSLKSLTAKDITRIISGEVSNWQEVGGPDAAAVLVGRESTEAVLSELRKSYPLLMTANYQHVFKRDHSVVAFLRSPSGRYAIAFGSLANFEGMNILNIKAQEYGIPLGLVIDVNSRDDPLVVAARRFAASPEWKTLARQAGFLAVE